MVGGTIFHRRMIQCEISRVLVLNLSGEYSGLKNRSGSVCSWHELRSYRGAPEALDVEGRSKPIERVGHPPNQPSIVEVLDGLLHDLVRVPLLFF
jgi:hypothetical protein